MAGLEGRESTPPIFHVDTSFMGVKLEGVEKRNIPHADLIQATMNASAIAAFGRRALRPNFATEGGVIGTYHGVPIELSNMEDHLGVFNDNYQYARDEDEGLWEVLGFYESFLYMMFELDLKLEGEWYPPETFLAAPSLQTTEAVWDKLDDTMRNIGSWRLPPKVMRLFTQDEVARRYLRGLTDEEIKRFYVDPPHA